MRPAASGVRLERDRRRTIGLFWTELALEVMLDAAMDGDAPSVSVTHVGAYDAGTPLTSVTGVTSTDTFTKTTHGMADGTAVKLADSSAARA